MVLGMEKIKKNKGVMGKGEKKALDIRFRYFHYIFIK